MKQTKKNKDEIISAMQEISKLRGIDEDLLFTALEDALTAAYRKNINDSSTQEIKSMVNRDSGEYRILNMRTVVDEITDESSQILLPDARKIKVSCEVGDVIEEDVTPKDFMRVAAQNAKQIVTQRIKEAERSIIYDEFSEKEFDLISGIVQRKDKGNVYVDLGKIEAVLGPNEQIPGERYEFNQRVDLYIVEVRQNTKGPMISVSRTHPGLVRRLFEREVPEIYNGTVEIKSTSREPGSRTKIAVHSNDPNVDATGSCVGNRGARVQSVVSELGNEKIDIIEWSRDPAAYIANSLSPAKVEAVLVNPDDNTARVIVDDSQLSLAIGKEGQNVRLAARLTGWKIDIKSSRDPETLTGFEAYADLIWHPGDEPRELPLRKTKVEAESNQKLEDDQAEVEEVVAKEVAPEEVTTEEVTTEEVTAEEVVTEEVVAEEVATEEVAVEEVVEETEKDAPVEESPEEELVEEAQEEELLEDESVEETSAEEIQE